MTFPSDDAEAHFIYGDKITGSGTIPHNNLFIVECFLMLGKALGKMAWEWSQQGYYNDPGYFLARGVLQLLCLKKIDLAQEAVDEFLKSFKEKGQCEQVDTFLATLSPLTNACQLFL